MSSYYFSEEHELFRQSLQAFLNKEVIPNIDQWEEEQRIPRDIWKKMGAIRCFLETIVAHCSHGQFIRARKTKIGLGITVLKVVCNLILFK